MIPSRSRTFALALTLGFVSSVHAQEPDVQATQEHAQALDEAAHELRDHATAHEHAANALAERGRAAAAALYRERARELFAEADRRKANAKDQLPPHARAEQAIGRLKPLLEKLRAEREALADSNAPEDVQDRAQKRIHAVEAQLQRIARRKGAVQEVPPMPKDSEPVRRMAEAGRRLEQLRLAAKNLKEAEFHDLALEVSRRADMLEKRLAEAKERFADEMNRRRAPEGLQSEIEELREHNERLRNEIRELREKLEQASREDAEADADEEEEGCDCDHEMGEGQDAEHSDDDEHDDHQEGHGDEHEGHEKVDN